VRYTLNRLRNTRLPRREAPAGLVGRGPMGPNVDDLVASLQLQRLLHHNVHRLRRIHREVLVLFDFEEWKAHEVARALSIPLFTFYSRLRVGRGKLAARLRREVGRPHAGPSI
jgi:DNA-directed RNA polymerase specialized sigma24 family protein